jgi:hypothetical protein
MKREVPAVLVGFSSGLCETGFYSHRCRHVLTLVGDAPLLAYLLILYI